MIDWTNIVESHVTRIFLKISYQWWGIDIQFYDEYGACRSGAIHFQNPLCRMICSTSKGVKLCSQTYQKNLRRFKGRKRHEPFFYQCYAGLQGFIVPILARQGYAGAMIGSGMRIFEDNVRCTRDTGNRSSNSASISWGLTDVMKI